MKSKKTEMIAASVFKFIFLRGGDVGGPQILRPTRILAEAVRDRNVYSVRSATIGSTRVARRAGRRHASNATVRSTIDTPVNVSGSVGDTP